MSAVREHAEAILRLQTDAAVEAVAQALHEQEYPWDEWARARQWQRDKARHAARAALSALVAHADRAATS